MKLTMYILTIQPRFEHVTTKFSRREFVDPIKAENAFVDQCDQHGLEWSEQMDGSFSSIGMSDVQITMEIQMVESTIEEKFYITFEAQGQTSTISTTNRTMADQGFESYVNAKKLIAHDPDPSGYRYAHNEDLTIRCWIESTPNC